MSPFNLATKAMPLNPMFWLALLIWTLLVAAGGMIYGASETREAAQLVERKAVIKAMERQATADAKELEKERALRDADRATFNEYRKAQDHANTETSRLIADLRGATARLRVPTRSCAPSQDAGGSAAGGTGQEGHAELSADAGVFVVGLLERGDTAIRKHAALVDLYESLRRACSAPMVTP